MTPQYLKNRITCKAKLKVEVILAIVLVTFLFIGCKKDLGSGGGDPGSDDSSQLKLAAGSLKDLSGACMPIIANGKYVYNTVLDDSNYIVVPVNFISAGKYSISTDTSNGFSFQTSGITTATGVQNIILKATGKPIGAYLTTFSIAFDTSICTFSVDVSDSVITPAITSNDYFPMTENSNWTYRHSGAIDGESLATVSAADTIIGGNDFKTFIYSQPDYNGGYSVSGKGYYRKADGLYYEYGYINDLTINLVADRTEFIF